MSGPQFREAEPLTAAPAEKIGSRGRLLVPTRAQGKSRMRQSVQENPNRASCVQETQTPVQSKRASRCAKRQATSNRPKPDHPNQGLAMSGWQMGFTPEEELLLPVKNKRMRRNKPLHAISKSPNAMRRHGSCETGQDRGGHSIRPPIDFGLDGFERSFHRSPESFHRTPNGRSLPTRVTATSSRIFSTNSSLVQGFP